MVLRHGFSTSGAGMRAFSRRLRGSAVSWKRQGQRFAVEWNGEPVQDIHKAFGNVVADAGLDADVTPHVLRHTAATWLMQNGVDMWEASGYLGMTVEMLSQRYGHHHPDHLSGAKHGIGRRRKLGTKLGPNESDFQLSVGRSGGALVVP